MGVTSVGSRETERFGEEDVSGPDGNQDGVARNSANLDGTLEGVGLRHVHDFAEGLDRMGAQPNSSIPATCATGSGNIGDPPYTNPGQVMSPNSRQNLPQDSLHVRELPKVETHLQPNEPSYKEETPASVPKREEFDVKEKPKSPSLPMEERETSQPSQPSHLPPERSADPDQDTSSGPSEAPWLYVMNRTKVRPVRL